MSSTTTKAPASFFQTVLDPPAYGFARDGVLYVPTARELFGEFFRRLNIRASHKNWLALFGWVTTLSFAWPLAVFLTQYFSFGLLVIGFLYSMVAMGSHGTFWLHRYSTHRAFVFRNRWIAMICRNLVIKVVPEEVYVVSHYVHHQFCEEPGDPYNAHAGFLYCFLADVNHQAIRRDFTEAEYDRVRKIMDHTGVRLNSYAQYQRWGTLAHPAWTLAHYAANWGFWFAVFLAIGGLPLATAIFGWAGVWAVGIRTFNYEGHGRGQDKRRDGVDFNRQDLSINQLWPGFVAGEWHNNHHLYPSGARSGFYRHQLDLPWLGIRALSAVGAITSYRDFQADFWRDYAGRGPLGGWVRATALHAALTLRRQQRHQVPLDEEQLLEIPATATDPELRYLRARYQPRFKQAFQASLAALSSRERTVLKMNVLDGLNIDQIGAVYKVHRSTVARWLAQAREQLLKQTRKRLARALEIGGSELASLERVLRSQLDLSLGALLKKTRE